MLLTPRRPRPRRAALHFLRFRSIAIAGLALCIGLSAAPALAQTPDASGAHGANGADGDPGHPGEDGAPGGDATALAETELTATAVGGWGGHGGAGGEAVELDADGAHGGHGGRGGDASATKTGAAIGVRTSAGATARGGYGGDGGPGGAGLGAGVTGGAGNGGHGGEATSTSNAEVSTFLFTLPVFAEAWGGRGGDAHGEGSAGDGGNATSHAQATTEGREGISASALAWGGNGGSSAQGSAGAGGVATATARATSNSGADAHARADQRMGHGAAGETGRGRDSILDNAVSGSTSGELRLGQISHAGGSTDGGNGGHATSILSATNPGLGDLSISSSATGGYGEIGGDARAHAYGTTNNASRLTVAASAAAGEGWSGVGTAIATAEGHSTGGGDVTVIARKVGLSSGQEGGAPPEEIRDAAHGSTSGSLTLWHEISGANGGGSGVRGGDVSSWLDASNPGGGSIHGRSFATGGHGAGGIGPSGWIQPGDGADAHASGRATDHSGAGASLRVVARGGFGGSWSAPGLDPDEVGGHGGNATLGEVFAWSNGGDVDVTGEASGGRARGTAGGNGASVALKDAVKGFTTGNLRLEQIATGGDAGHSRITLSDEAGRAGDASSELTKYTSSKHLTVEVRAIGGEGGNGYDGAAATSGGNASTTGFAWNDAGGATVHGRATGRDGGRLIDSDPTTQAGNGGDATNRVTAVTVGDGHDIEIAPHATDTRVASAAAGRGGPNSERRQTGDGPIGNGGNAASQSFGVALGDSRVRVVDAAVGGDGSRGLSSHGGVFGNGGHAQSHAEASNRGLSEVTARSAATGGSSSVDGTRSGDATARALASGQGIATATSHAAAGITPTFPPVDLTGGAATASSQAEGRLAALASSQAEGATGQAQSSALLRTEGLIDRANIESSASIASEVSATTASISQVRFESTTAAPGLDGIDSYGLVVIKDEMPASHSVPFAEITLGGGLAEAGDITEFDHEVVVEMVLDLAVLEADLPLGLTMFDGAESSGDGFEGLDFIIEMGDVTLVERHFESEESAENYFSSTLLSLGVPSERSGELAKLRITFDLDFAGDPSRFGTKIQLKQIPEPGTAVGVGLGMIMIGISRRRALRKH